jgi:hypothetical protein
MGQFFLQFVATLIAAALVLGIGWLVIQWQKRRDATLALLAEFQRFDADKIRLILEKHIPRRNRARRMGIDDGPAYTCTYGQLNADLSVEERRVLAPFVNFFERLVLLYEGGTLDKRLMWSVLGRQINWWQEQLFWVVEPNDPNNSYGIASQVTGIAAKHKLEVEPWWSLVPKVNLIPKRSKDRAAR